MTHVTGPGCVKVSVRFGTTPDSGPWIIRRSAIDSDIEPQMNIEEYIEEVSQGVARGNKQFGTEFEVEEIEIIPDDFPTKGQVAHCAFKLVEFAVNQVREQDSAHQSTTAP